MASSSSSKDKRNFQCVTEASLEIIKLPLKAILRSQIKPEDLFLKIKSSLLLSGRNKLRPDQLSLCYFPPPLLPDYSKFDVTLLYTLIRNLCSGLEPTRGWGNEPGPNDTKIGDDIERLRLFRNKNYAHLNSATIPDDTFEDLWKTLKAVLSRLKSHSGCGVDYEQDLIEIKRSLFRYEIWEDYRNLWKVYLEIEKEANERAEPSIYIKGEEQVICGDTAEFKAEVKQAESFSFSIKWQRRRGRFVEIIDTTLEKYRGSTNTKLVIPSACKEDAWEYQASLSYENNHMFPSNAINLHVLGEIPFLNDLIVTVEDEKIIIHYSVGVPENSPHIQNIRWSKNGHPMYIESVKFIGGSPRDSCLIINSPSEADKGKYSCTVTNAVGSETKHIVLDVPCIEISIESPVHLASDTTLTSIVSSMPPPEKAQWQKSNHGKDFSELEVTKSKYFGSNVSPECPRLVIPKTTFEDMLYYRLQISNKLGVNVSNIVYLEVTGSLPNITVGHETDINNRSIKLRGVVFLSKNSPDIQNVFWSKNGEKIDVQGSGGRLSGVTIDDPSLTIRDVSQEDAGKYQLTAINAVGPNDSDVISIDVPYLCIRSEKEFTGGIECMCFTVEITSNPGPCHAQWNIKSKGEETFTPLDVNAEKYQGSTNSLPHPKLVIKEKDQLKKNIYQIEVTNFVGSTVEEISDDENRPLQKQKGSMENTLYEDKGAGLKFALLNNDLANQFPVEKLKLLKFIIQSSDKVPDVTSLKSAASAMECFTILQDEKIFSKRDVIFVQFLCKVTGCKELYEKCKDYALSQKALCCFERQIENGYTKVQFHVQGDLNNYTRENIVNIVETVAGILNCRTDEILVNGVYHSRSFMLVLSMRDIYSKKWMNLSERDCHHLTSLHIDYFILNQKIFQLESSKDLVKSKIAVLDDELLFAKLCGDLANDFPLQKFQQLRSILCDSSKTRKMESLMAANSVLECFAYLLEENLFSKADVSFIQFICKETNCEELKNKCVEYARRQGIHFFEEEISERKPVYIIDETCTKYKIHQCSKCPADAEYFCVSCPCDLCSQCKENHVKDLQTIDHDVVSHRDKINYIPTQEICVRHPSHVYTKYCDPCELPVCFHCRKHRTHRQLDVRTACKTKRQQHRGTIHTIRSEAVFYRPVLLPLIKTDFKTCHTELSLFQSEMLTKAQTLKHLINIVKRDFMHNVFCDFDFKHRCLKQMIEMSRHIVSLERYENIYEQSAFSALKFLSSIKTAFCQIYLELHSSQLSITESLNKEDVMESLSAIQIKERGNRRVGNQCLLKLSSGAEFHQSLTVTDVHCCCHISCVTSDRVWVSDGINKLILTDTTGVPLHRVGDLCSCYVGGNGFHTVNSESELIYIDWNYNINKLSTDMKTTTTFIERTDSSWEPGCVYWSPFTGDLLVGMHKLIMTGKVTRYNQSGQLTQTIQHDNKGLKLYEEPGYITENNNGNVVVSDSNAVVVTERGGRHRFSYTGHPSGSGLEPRGICTDALSHILVCDGTTNTVQMINKDGQFLSYLLIRPSGIFRPWSLSYDINTHRLWVGSLNNNKVYVYRYITRKDTPTDRIRRHGGGEAMSSSAPCV